jgi:glycine/D-amino acid oxidase-like deaminating enzyme
VPTGVLWLAGQDVAKLSASRRVLERCGIAHDVLERPELEARYPQINFADVQRGVLETESGVLLARRAVACVVEDAARMGAQFEIAQVAPAATGGTLTVVDASTGEPIHAGQFVFACGPWLGKIFPDILAQRIFPTRQEVFFFGCPSGERQFAPPALPTWLFQDDEVYGMPDIESRGLKVARDLHGERVDPDTHSRLVSKEGAAFAKEYVRRRFPGLRDAEIVETRVCQYENTSNGDFLLDRHPDMRNIWLAGGGSGHGFKHGPAVGEYLAGQILGTGEAEARFSFASKATEQKRAVF